MRRLEQILRRIDGRGYKAYRDIRGTYRFEGFTLTVEHVQGDPFADPSRIRVMVPVDRTWIGQEHVSSTSRRVALRDFMTRRFAQAIRNLGAGHRGSGKSGLISVDVPGPEILDRSSCLLTDDVVEIRFRMGLPAAGRRILGRQAWTMFAQDVPRLVRETFERDYFREALEHCQTAEDADFLRQRLSEMGLVAFIAEGAILPRRSGVDFGPMEGAVPFGPVPDTLAVEVGLPNAGRVRGLGIPRGVTLIVGGGYHGKSTLLDAIAMGIYNHIPGDGRQLVVTDSGAVTVRSEDGRRVEGVDISPFISGLPGGRDTTRFSSEDASGSTSQAANIVEAMEAGATALILDEDTSANNFLVRDFRMQMLVHRDREPITPFVDRVRQLYDELGISTVMVLGGSGDYLDVADVVIQMDAYQPVDVTGQAREICRRFPTLRHQEATGSIARPRGRVPDPESFDPSRGSRREKIKSVATRAIVFGHHEIDVSYLDQLADPSQTRFISDVILYAWKHHMDGRTTLADAIAKAMNDMRRGGFDALTEGRFDNRAAVRPHEVMAAVNRLRTLRIV